MNQFADYSFAGQKALVRVDFNVPLDNHQEITDDTRMRAAVPTIRKILQDGGSVILMSHLGRPSGGPEEKYSLSHLVQHLGSLLRIPIKFAKDCIGPEALKASEELKPGEVLLLENLRFHREEEKGDEEFARKLASLGEVYVNDAFGTAHRAHASTAVIAQFFPRAKRMFGLLMEAEIGNAERVLHRAEKPFTAILGGAKVSDKIEIIKNLIIRADHIIIGGGMAFTFLKALGKETGSSLCEQDKLGLARELMEQAKEHKTALILPVDSVIADKFAVDAQVKVVDNDHILPGWMGLDIGPASVLQFKEVIQVSKTILWNGPMGVFEMPPFCQGTRGLADAIVLATARGAFSLVGGGDSVAAINQFGMADKVSYVSTGGGALLEYFEGKELPGIAAIREG
ncbi:MAG TPA: phosphoglycerate kinase [Chitinophagaceae bacterium]|nr:phosphoglycerate kinase [Chitinophagaceae bacterium]